jgi:hypothetical protein
MAAEREVFGKMLIIGQTDSEFSKNDPKCAEAEGSYELNKFLLAEYVCFKIRV